VGELFCFVKAVEGTPDGACVFVEFALSFGYCLAFGYVSSFHLGLYPKIDLAVEKYFIGDKPGFVHLGESAFVEEGVGGLDVHWFHWFISSLVCFINTPLRPHFLARALLRGHISCNFRVL